ncbi:hypothetical protein BJ983_001788 [Actinomycetospora corticicola]|uniref:Uncharacterized protein n=1 Tax=Actinomycetospora corticicola TaxID=663602 RepID=A0A7Y9DUC1_9PSEU|nr:hypothetical protein [Actinomycetospora corticicola]
MGQLRGHSGLPGVHLSVGLLLAVASEAWNERRAKSAT